jgi:hypothetical protein
MLALVGAALIVGGCGPQARPATSTPPAASVAPVDTTTPNVGGAGYLEGHASIGPLQPVERVGVPPPTPSPATCTARGLIVIDLHTGTDVARYDLDPDCTYHADSDQGPIVTSPWRQALIASNSSAAASTSARTFRRR